MHFGKKDGKDIGGKGGKIRPSKVRNGEGGEENIVLSPYLAFGAHLNGGENLFRKRKRGGSGKEIDCPNFNH